MEHTFHTDGASKLALTGRKVLEGSIDDAQRPRPLIVFRWAMLSVVGRAAKRGRIMIGHESPEFFGKAAKYQGWQAKVRALAIVLAISLSESSDAATIDKRRILAPETIASLSDARAVALMPQHGMAVLGRRFSVATASSVAGATSIAISNSGLLAYASPFAGGFITGFLGSVAFDSVAERRVRRFMLLSRSLLVSLKPSDEWSELQARWQDRLSRALMASGFASEVAAITHPREELEAKGIECAREESCISVSTTFGFSDDGLRIEAQTHVEIWTPGPRGLRLFGGGRPDFHNVLLYRSAPVPRLDRSKSEEDRRWLMELAALEYRMLQLGPLIERANSGRDQDAMQAREVVAAHLKDDHFRKRRAKAKKWRDDSLALVTARRWSEDDAKLLRETLLEAMEETARMLEVELTAEAQAAKQRDRFPRRHARKVATVIRPGVERELVYLNDGTLLSRPTGDDSEIGDPWEAFYDEREARLPVTE